MKKEVKDEDLSKALSAVVFEIKYQDNLQRRTDDEAKDIPGFLTLARRYIRLCEDVWADNAGIQTDNGYQVLEAQENIRKLAAIFVRAMCYNGVVERQN